MTSSSRSEETKAQESPTMLLQLLHWKTTGEPSLKDCSNVRLESAGTSEFAAISVEQST